MSIILSKKSQEFIKKNKISNLFIDINFIEEKCVQIYEPKIKIIEGTDLNEYNIFESISTEKLTIFLSEKFIQISGVKIPSKSEHTMYIILSFPIRPSRN